MSLTDRQEMFIQEFKRDLNATEAAIRCGYSEKSAKRIGYGLRHHPVISQRLDEDLGNRRDRTVAETPTEEAKQTQGEIVRELRRIAFSDPKRVVYWEGDKLRLKKFEDVTEDEAAAISEISMTRTGLRVKFRNKEAALGQLAGVVGAKAGSGESSPLFDFSKFDFNYQRYLPLLLWAARTEAVKELKDWGRAWAKVVGEEVAKEMVQTVKDDIECADGWRSGHAHTAQMMQAWKRADPAKYARWEAGLADEERDDGILDRPHLRANGWGVWLRKPWSPPEER